MYVYAKAAFLSMHYLAYRFITLPFSFPTHFCSYFLFFQFCKAIFYASELRIEVKSGFQKVIISIYLEYAL